MPEFRSLYSVGEGRGARCGNTVALPRLGGRDGDPRSFLACLDQWIFWFSDNLLKEKAENDTIRHQMLTSVLHTSVCMHTGVHVYTYAHLARIPEP